jgi:ABC-type sugar transport system substrate-binding protein
VLAGRCRMASGPRSCFAGQRHLLRLAGKTARALALFPERDLDRYRSFGQISSAQAATAVGPKPTIPVIVKDKTSLYWQTVLAGARQAGRDLGVNVIELGADSETDINGQIGILAQAVAPIPAAIVIAPAQFAALGKPIDGAAKQVKIIGIDSEADSSAFTSFVKTDNVQAGRLAADILADAIKRTAFLAVQGAPGGRPKRRGRQRPPPAARVKRSTVLESKIEK